MSAAEKVFLEKGCEDIIGKSAGRERMALNIPPASSSDIVHRLDTNHQASLFSSLLLVPALCFFRI